MRPLKEEYIGDIITLITPSPHNRELLYIFACVGDISHEESSHVYIVCIPTTDMLKITENWCGQVKYSTFMLLHLFYASDLQRRIYRSNYQACVDIKITGQSPVDGCWLGVV